MLMGTKGTFPHSTWDELWKLSSNFKVNVNSLTAGKLQKYDDVMVCEGFLNENNGSHLS